MVEKKILLVTLSNLGDVVLTLPVLQSLRHAYPAAEFHVMVSPGSKSVFEKDPRVRRVLVYDKKQPLRFKWELLRSVRHEKYDIIVDLRHSLIGLLGGARQRNSYWPWRGSKRLHRRDRHLRALRGVVPIWNEESFFKSRTHRIPEPLKVPGKPWVLAAVGSKSDVKKWPARHFAETLDRLSLEDGYRVALIGDTHDAEDAAAVKKLMVSPVTDLTGRTDLEELVAAISSALLVITNDSAPLHIADSLKVPVLALFGPTDPGKYGPRFSRSLAVSRSIFCSPCEKAQCRYHHECLDQLSVEEVCQKARWILGDKKHENKLKVLIIRLDRLGDTVLSLSAIRAVREHSPDAKISVLLRPATRSILEGHPDLDEVMTYDYGRGGRHRFGLGYWRLLREITRRRFDVAFILHPGLRSSLLPFLTGIPYRVGYGGPFSFLQTLSVPDLRHTGSKHESEYALDLLTAFGITTPQVRVPNIPVSPLLSAKMGNLLSPEGAKAGERWIALHAGASCQSKRWPLERFEELARRVLAEFPHHLVIIGGKEEVPLGKRLHEALGAKVMDLTGELNLKELSALLKRCELLVSNDSGPVHVAAAVGTRVLSIFGRNQAGLSPRRWRPLGQGHVVIQKDVGCVVCLAHDCPIEFECLKAISVDEVFSQVRLMLTSKERVAAQ